jgi:hypothetical protein
MHALILALLSNICIIKSDCVVYLDVWKRVHSLKHLWS